MKKFIICTILTLGFTNLNALPSGEDTTFAGSNTTVSTSTDGITITMTITQDTSYEKAIIEWESFNIDVEETFEVIQQNNTDILLNRVTGLSQSVINGKIEANGSVWIINKNGIAFGEGAVIDVYGFLASTLEITDENFQLDQSYIFSGAEENPVVNNGSIISNGIAGYVVLAGHQVVNNGYIAARFGKVALVAGEAMTVDFNGDGLVIYDLNSSQSTNTVTNEGIIDISSQIVAPDLADNTLTNLVVESNALPSTVSQAGDVLIFGSAATINGKISANGSQEGEDIVDGGDITINVVADQSGSGLTLGEDSLIEAVSENGTSGSVVISSQGNNDLRGNIDLSTKSGNAGTLEVDSDGFLLFVGSKIDLSSTDGD